jgi:hypothetical protein
MALSEQSRAEFEGALSRRLWRVLRALYADRFEPGPAGLVLEGIDPARGGAAAVGRAAGGPPRADRTRKVPTSLAGAALRRSRKPCYFVDFRG